MAKPGKKTVLVVEDKGRRRDGMIDDDEDFTSFSERERQKTTPTPATVTAVSLALHSKHDSVCSCSHRRRRRRTCRPGVAGRNPRVCNKPRLFSPGLSSNSRRSPRAMRKAGRAIPRGRKVRFDIDVFVQSILVKVRRVSVATRRSSLAALSLPHPRANASCRNRISGRNWPVLMAVGQANRR